MTGLAVGREAVIAVSGNMADTPPQMWIDTVIDKVIDKDKKMRIEYNRLFMKNSRCT